MTPEKIIHYAMTGAVGLVSGIVGTLGAVNISLAELKADNERQDAKDVEIAEQIARIDREGTQISRADRQAIVKLETRLDRMDSNQALALAQGARNEALLLDLKQRLKQ
jgi:hypothetical protein